MLSGYITGEVCADCGKLLKCDFGGLFVRPGCCPSCGSTKEPRFVIGRAVYTTYPPPGCLTPHIHAFFEQGKEPGNFDEVVKKHEKGEFPTLELVLFVLGLFVGAYISFFIAITWLR